MSLSNGWTMFYLTVQWFRIESLTVQWLYYKCLTVQWLGSVFTTLKGWTMLCTTIQYIYCAFPALHSSYMFQPVSRPMISKYPIVVFDSLCP